MTGYHGRAVTYHHRKYAVRVLKHGYKRGKPACRASGAGRSKRKGRTAIYGSRPRYHYRGEVVDALEQIWEIYGSRLRYHYGRICLHLRRYKCSKRLHPYLPEGIKVLERCGELTLATKTKELLLHIMVADCATISRLPAPAEAGSTMVAQSATTIDRCLAPVRFKSSHGLSTTKPGTLLKW